MNIELEEAFELIKKSISRMESLENELKDTRNELDMKSRRLEIEVAKNIQLNEELERLHTKVAQLTKIDKRPLVNRVTEVMTHRAHTPSKEIKRPPEKKIIEQGTSDAFSLADVPLNYRSVISKTSHLHHFLLSKLHVKTPRLRLWLNNSEVDKYYKAKQVLLKVETNPSELLTDKTIQTPTLNSTSSYVTKATLLREVELPHFLIDIGKLTLETFGSNVSISQVLEINDMDRKKFSVPVGITLPGLKSHLKKRIKQRSPLKLETSETIESTCPRQDTASIVSVNKALSTSSSLNDNATQYDSLLGPKAQYTTRKGKVLSGWFIEILPKEELKKIDPYTFEVDGRFFVRECYGDVLLTAIRSFMCTSRDTVHTGQEDSSYILKLLDEEFLFSNIRMASESVLFEFDDCISNKILINTAHPYLQQASSLSNDFWKSMSTFMALWRLLKKMNLQNEAKEQISLARTQLMRTLTMYVEKKNTLIYKMYSLPSNVLFDVSSFASGLLVHVNENHPFNEYYLMTLKQNEKETFFQIYAAWLHAEKETLSNSTEVALKVTRQLIGTEFYHLVDEIRHGSDLF